MYIVQINFVLLLKKVECFYAFGESYEDTSIFIYRISFLSDSRVCDFDACRDALAHPLAVGSWRRKPVRGIGLKIEMWGSSGATQEGEGLPFEPELPVERRVAKMRVFRERLRSPFGTASLTSCRFSLCIRGCESDFTNDHRSR